MLRQVLRLLIHLRDLRPVPASSLAIVGLLLGALFVACGDDTSRSDGAGGASSSTTTGGSADATSSSTSAGAQDPGVQCGTTFCLSGDVPDHLKDQLHCDASCEESDVPQCNCQVATDRCFECDEQSDCSQEYCIYTSPHTARCSPIIGGTASLVCETDAECAEFNKVCVQVFPEEDDIGACAFGAELPVIKACRDE